MTQSRVRAPTGDAADVDTYALGNSTWETLALTEAETEGLAVAADRACADPERDAARFRREARVGGSALSDSTVARLDEFARGKSARPELHITNLPIHAALPPTPTTGQSTDALASVLSQFLMVTFSLSLGLPISYRDQRGGRLFHDIFPTEANAGEVSSQSSAAQLGFHTEMFFHPEPPDFLVLHCLRGDPGDQAATGIASSSDIFAHLELPEIEILSEKLFALDLARLHGAYRHKGQKILESDPRPLISLLEHVDNQPRFRFEPELTTPVTTDARRVLAKATKVAADVTVEGKLRAGEMLLIDNRRAVHSRSSFRARFDGKDRWLRRMMVGRGGRVENGIHSRPDLEICRAWKSAGAVLAPIPYVSEDLEGTV